MKTRRFPAAVVVSALGWCCTSLFCFAAGPALPALKAQRAEEDWSRFTFGESGDPYLHTKHLKLGGRDSVWLSLGGDARWRYERVDNLGWGAAMEDTDGYFLQRYMIHADLHLGDHLRLFGQLMSGLEQGRTPGPRPLDRDEADFHQLFLQGAAPAGDWRFELRIGRQELAYGSSRLISIRDAPNVRLTFDGVKLISRWRGWQFDALWMRPVVVDPAVFDDRSTAREQLWGLYATTPEFRPLRLRADVYYLGLRRDDAAYFSVIGDELRHSAGVRLFGGSGAWDMNFEAVVQWGEIGSNRIRAWTVASDTGFTFSSMPWRPRLGLKADITSGDDDARDRTLGTFNALFPRGAYFNELALIGPFNHTDLSPSLTLRPSDTVTLTTQANFFWRTETADAVYNNGGDLARAPLRSDERRVGTVLQTQLDWQLHRSLAFTAVWARFFTGPFLRETGPASDSTFVGAWLTLRF